MVTEMPYSDQWNNFGGGANIMSPAKHYEMGYFNQPQMPVAQVPNVQVQAPTTQMAAPTATAGVPGAANPMSAFEMMQQNQMLQSVMPRDYWGNPMGMDQATALQAQQMGMLPEGFDVSGLPMEHGFMDKMGGMKGLMGVGQLATTGMGLYNSFKQMQMQKDMFNAQKGIMNQNGQNQAKAYNTALTSKMRNRDIATGGSYGGAERAEKEKAVWNKV
jgi:hypothetical protein